VRQYLDLLQHLVTHGRRKPNRTGVDTIGVFGWQMRFPLMNGFPLVTTKEVNLRAIIHELLWFLEGSTDNERLRQMGAKIWDLWAVKEGTVVDREGPDGVEQVLVKKGELGPIYGKQWRRWSGPDGMTIDQVADAIRTLRENPFSRRIIVSAWNPADLPDETKSPEQNVLDGRMALAACHTMFQFFTEILTFDERVQITLSGVDDASTFPRGELESLGQVDEAAALMDSYGVPRYRLSCQLYQRSCDVPVGLPFNIASYALLTHMVAQVVGMAVGDFVWTGGDVHIYVNQLDGIHEQLKREPLPLPKLRLNPNVREIDDFRFEDIRIEDYVAHPAIRYEVAK